KVSRRYYQDLAGGVVPAISSSARVSEDKIGRLFRNHQSRRVRVAGGDGRHHGSVGDAKARDSTNLQGRVNDGFLIRTHLAGSDGMKDRCPDQSRSLHQFLFRLEVRPRLELLRAIGFEGL